MIADHHRPVAQHDGLANCQIGIEDQRDSAAGQPRGRSVFGHGRFDQLRTSDQVFRLLIAVDRSEMEGVEAATFL